MGIGSSYPKPIQISPDNRVRIRVQYEKSDDLVHLSTQALPAALIDKNLHVTTKNGTRFNFTPFEPTSAEHFRTDRTISVRTKFGVNWSVGNSSYDWRCHGAEVAAAIAELNRQVQINDRHCIRYNDDGPWICTSLPPPAARDIME